MEMKNTPLAERNMALTMYDPIAELVGLQPLHAMRSYSVRASRAQAKSQKWRHQ
jgi:hypothetical protein